MIWKTQTHTDVLTQMKYYVTRSSTTCGPPSPPHGTRMADILHFTMPTKYTRTRCLGGKWSYWLHNMIPVVSVRSLCLWSCRQTHTESAILEGRCRHITNLVYLMRAVACCCNYVGLIMLNHIPKSVSIYLRKQLLIVYCAQNILFLVIYIFY